MTKSQLVICHWSFDAVVWSLGQKYERGDDELYNIIRDKIIIEEVLKE
jgi:hypothetical protein